MRLFNSNIKSYIFSKSFGIGIWSDLETFFCLDSQMHLVTTMRYIAFTEKTDFETISNK